ncbi:MAG: hypothetical protein ACJAS1_005634 [Oleiphilaceae bacterium]|jgi:hypothetical protein
MSMPKVELNVMLPNSLGEHSKYLVNSGYSIKEIFEAECPEILQHILQKDGTFKRFCLVYFQDKKVSNLNSLIHNNSTLEVIFPMAGG